MFEKFAKKWGLETSQIRTVFEMVQGNGGKYGKTHRQLETFYINLSTRQIRYFYRSCKLALRYGSKEEIGGENYIKLVEKAS